ncbi:hypothetical protein FPZ24_08180 [Sphingomonas panacisoli]|uniref:Uncharacterized protein n=1 Tax=Sphingomonas panacisoli TaxID=1813879 RepID=A0A5B8LK34_9SPHN|nr:hypothetical protein [Sphingomonas panacisoli]QDZ07460.1 hypothetical protein FPZ24_08180 [Sphingomonas panacisoli]
MAALSYHFGTRGYLGFNTYITGPDGISRGGVIPAFSLVDSNGVNAGAGTSASPTVTQSQGTGSFATSQAASSISPAAALSVVAARAGRQAVTFTNITGTQPVYFTANAATTGVTTGFFLAGTAGASVTIATSAQIFATSPTAAQTLGVLETF